MHTEGSITFYPPPVMVTAEYFGTWKLIGIVKCEFGESLAEVYLVLKIQAIGLQLMKCDTVRGKFEVLGYKTIRWKVGGPPTPKLTT